VPGLAAVPIEEIDADAFEARRQTYVRNLSGEWHKVKLGRMFVEMLNTLVVSSNRELAAQLGITEGTVRNTILYSTAAKLAAERDDAPDEDVIAMMSVREVRKLLAWLMGDADQEEGHQAAAAAPEARILARLKRAWNKATEEERAEFLAWTGYVTHQARNGYAEPPYERQMDIETCIPSRQPRSSPTSSWATASCATVTQTTRSSLAAVCARRGKQRAGRRASSPRLQARTRQP
jgi:hypothetical protein